MAWDAGLDRKETEELQQRYRNVDDQARCREGRSAQARGGGYFPRLFVLNVAFAFGALENAIEIEEFVKEITSRPGRGGD